MSTQLIKTLITHLPRYAEEEGDFYAVKREDLINALCSEHVNQAVAKNTVELCENLLDTLAVLNTNYLTKGEWCFISFPAQLLALSVLTAMSDKESRLLADNFWNTQGISDDKKNKQRDLLHAIETNRVNCHVNNAPPIRYIYVAWSIIKLDDKILFHQRESSEHTNQYGLIGGRLNQRDIPTFTTNKELYLQKLQSNDALLIEETLPETLKRELSEEAGLIFETHYTFKSWRSLKPYSEVQGAAPNCALTEYYFTIFYINLTLEGYVFLQQKIESDTRLVLFSIEEVVQGKTTEGKEAYIKALFDDFSDNRVALKTELINLPNSFIAGYLYQPKDKNNYALILPITVEQPLLAGFKGKEKPLGIMLMPRQLDILLGLAAHSRGFDFTAQIETTFHPYGWVEVTNNSVLQSELIELSRLFKLTDFKIEIKQNTFFRWSVDPSMIYFDAQLFTYTVQQADLHSKKLKVDIVIRRAAILTAFGLTADKVEVFTITRTLARNLHKLSQPRDSAYDDEQAIEDSYKKALQQDNHFSALALKSLLCRKNGRIEFGSVYQVN